ncbi:MAG: hypothetical protein V5A32_03440 [Halovenus sp.]
MVTDTTGETETSQAAEGNTQKGEGGNQRGVTDTPDNAPKHLVVLDYEDDAERKRAQYQLENWERGRSHRLSGMARIVEGEGFDALYESLLAKVNPDHLSVYKISERTIDIEDEHAAFRIRYPTERDSVEYAIQSILRKRKTVVRSSQNNEFTVKTKKGNVTLQYRIETSDDDTILEIELEGYQGAPTFLEAEIMDDLEWLVDAEGEVF